MVPEMTEPTETEATGGNGNGDYGGNGITQRNGATEDFILLLARLSGETLPSRHSIALKQLHCSI